MRLFRAFAGPSADQEEPDTGTERPRHRGFREPRYDAVNVGVWLGGIGFLVAFWTGVTLLVVEVLQ